MEDGGMGGGAKNVWPKGQAKQNGSTCVVMTTEFQQTPRRQNNPC